MAHTHHPDSGILFKSIQVPFLQQAIELVKSAARSIPAIRWIGWDLAITPQGAVLIEGNGAPGFAALQVLTAALHPRGAGCRQQLAALG